MAMLTRVSNDIGVSCLLRFITRPRAEQAEIRGPRPVAGFQQFGYSYRPVTR